MKSLQFRFSPGNSITFVYRMKFIISQKGKQLAVLEGYFYRAGSITTSRDRPKSAPYPRLKNSKKTSKCQVFSFTVLENRKFLKKMDRVARRGSLARAPGALKSHNAEKLKGGPFRVFQHPFCRKTSKI